METRIITQDASYLMQLINEDFHFILFLVYKPNFSIPKTKMASSHSCKRCASRCIKAQGSCLD